MTQVNPIDPNEWMTAIQERVDAATPGPWDQLPGSAIVIRPLSADGAQFQHIITGSHGAIGDSWGAALQADAAFIAHAREDIPALLAAHAQMRQREAELLAFVHYVASVPLATSDAERLQRIERQARATLRWLDPADETQDDAG